MSAAESDEFDAAAAAARATGSDPAPEPGSESGGDPTDESDGEAGETDDSGASKGLIAAFVLPLFLASESGPTSSTFREFGISQGVADVLDGVTDYVLSFVDLGDDELGDNLGPAGKIGIGLSRMTPDESGEDTANSGGESDAEHGDAPVIEGVEAA